MKIKRGGGSDEDEENEQEELQPETNISFIQENKRDIMMMLFISFFQFMSDLVNLLSNK